jgi:pilus assembly protein CpaC
LNEKLGGRRWLGRRIVRFLAATSFLVPVVPAVATAQYEPAVTRVDLPIGRSFPIETTVPITRVSVASPDIADVVVVDERSVVINARAPGETDVILWGTGVPRRHYRILVHSPADRMQIVLGIKMAEVRRDALRTAGVSGLYRDQHTRVGTGIFRSDNVFNQTDNTITIPTTSNFLTVLTDFDTDRLLAFIDAEETRGRAKLLAEPNLMAANKEEATFLAGGELPIPIAQPNPSGATNVTIQFREFGIRLRFVAEIVSDSLIKLAVRPEVSSLDYANAIVIAGFSIPAFRTRRVESTIDVRRNESLVISGLFNEEEERTRTGIPLLMNLPIVGQLFSSTRFQKNQSELLVVVTPIVVDPMRPRARDALRLAPDSTLPAAEAIKKRLPGGAPPTGP